MTRQLLLWSMSCWISVGCVNLDGEIERGRHAIIGGDPAPVGSFEATGALLSGGQVLCTGTLIAPDEVLTAAHCLTPLLTGPLPPSFTLARDATSASAEEIVAGRAVVVHPQATLFMSEGLGINYDVGLVELAAPIDGVPPAVLPRPGQGDALPVGTFVDIVGYGVTSTDPFASLGVKHQARTELLQIGTHEILLSEPGQPQQCRGDSGGPVFADVGEGLRLMATTSRGEGGILATCDVGHGINTRVDAYLEFIHANADIPCGSGLSPPCSEADAGVDDSDDHRDAGGTDDDGSRFDAGGGRPDTGGAPAGDVDGPGCSVGEPRGGAPGAWIAIVAAAPLAFRRRRRRKCART